MKRYWKPLLLCLILVAGTLAGLRVTGVSEAPKTATSAEKPADRKEAPRLLVVKIHADWCPACRNVDPAYHAVKKHFAKEKAVQFVDLDITDRNRMTAAYDKAEALGIQGWFHQNKTRTASVAIFTRPDNHQLGLLVHEAREEVYIQVIREALSQTSAP